MNLPKCLNQTSWQWTPPHQEESKEYLILRKGFHWNMQIAKVNILLVDIDFHVHLSSLSPLTTSSDVAFFYLATITKIPPLLQMKHDGTSSTMSLGSVKITRYLTLNRWLKIDIHRQLNAGEGKRGRGWVVEIRLNCKADVFWIQVIATVVVDVKGSEVIRQMMKMF